MTLKTASEALACNGITQAKRRVIEMQQEIVRESLADIDRFEVKIGHKDVSEARRLRSSSSCSGLNLPNSARPPSPISSGFYDYSQTPRKSMLPKGDENYSRKELKLGLTPGNHPDGVIPTNHGKLEWVVEKLVLKPRVTGITPVTQRRMQSAGEAVWRPGTSSTQHSVLRGPELPMRSSSSAGATLSDMKQKRRGLKSAGTMSGSSEAGTFVNDIPDYEQGLDFDTCDWLDDVVETEHAIGEGWEGAMQQHRLSASGARGGSSVSYNDIEDTAGFDKTLTYKNVNVFTISQAMALEAQRSNSRASAASRSDRPRSSWSGFSMLDSIYLPKSSHPRGYEVTIPGELFQRKAGAASGLGPFETKFQADFVAKRSEAFENERKRRQAEYNAMLAHNHKHKTDGRDDARAELRLRAAQRVEANQTSGVYFARTRLRQEQEKLREVQLRLEAKAEKERLQGLTPAQAAEEARGCLSDLNAFDARVKRLQTIVQ